jgi:hypothetical protein
MRVKDAQEKPIKSSGIRYTIVHATLFFEFATRIVDGASDGDTVRLPAALIQPMAGDDVAAVCEVALDGRSTNTIEIAGPDRCGSRSSSDRACAPSGMYASLSSILRLGSSGRKSVNAPCSGVMELSSPRLDSTTGSPRHPRIDEDVQRRQRDPTRRTPPNW